MAGKDGSMRGLDERSGELFSYVELEQRVPARHPLRAIRTIVNEALAALNEEFQAIYASTGRPSIPPEKLCGRSSCNYSRASVRDGR
jgi:transposase